MRCYKLFLALVLVLVLVLIPLHLDAQRAEVQGTNVIYLLDVSKSMRTGGLFGNIKERLQGLVRERVLHDRVVLITFGEEVNTVLDREIHSSKDIEDINRQIGNLRADSEWTWMSRAFEETKEKARNIKSQPPSKSLIIYLLTDCENDPPPNIREPKGKFIEVLYKYFKDFRLQDTSIYLMAYRPLDEEEKQQIAQTPVEVKEPQSDHPLPRIVLATSGFHWGMLDLSRGEVTQKGEIRVRKMEGLTRETVQVSAGPRFRVSPASFECREIGQSVTLSMVIPPDLAPGKHTEVINFKASRAMMEPRTIEVGFTVASLTQAEPRKDSKKTKTTPREEEPRKTPWWIYALVVLGILAGLAWILKSALPASSKNIWIETEDKQPHEATIQGRKLLWLGRQDTPPYLDLGLPKYYLTLEKNRRVMLGQTGTSGLEAVEFNKDLTLEGGEGKVKLRFLETEPSPSRDIVEPHRNDRPTGPMDEI